MLTSFIGVIYILFLIYLFKKSLNKYDVEHQFLLAISIIIILFKIHFK